MTYFFKQKHLKMKDLGLIFFIFMSAAAYAMIAPAPARALDGWQAGNIISDAVFTHANSMSVSQIQTFLNSKVPTCDTNGTLPASEFGRPDLTHAQYAASVGWPAPPYICLKNYKENDLSAAQIIYDISQAYNINPQVFIVLLQKEQGLVTDTWPLPNQYKMATGYGCPDDGSGCDSKYYGFTAQLHWAATLFRAIITGDQIWSNPYGSGTSWYSPYIVGTNYIQYNPSTSCGGTNVNIQNRATAALYDYTPYQPNQAALDAGFGTAFPCGAYGNRNFFLYFTNWFGSTYVPLVFKTTVSDQAYLLNGNKYYRINSSSMLSAYGFDRSDIGIVTSNMLSLYQDGGVLKNITRIDDENDIYLVDRGKLLRFPSEALYNSYGYTVDGNEQNLDSIILDSVGIGSTLTEVIRSNDRPEIYVTADGKKSHISDQNAYRTIGTPIYSTRTVTTLSQTFVSSLPLGPPIITANSFVRDSSTNKSYYWDGSGLQLIGTGTAVKLGLDVGYTSPTVSQLARSVNPTISTLAKDIDNKLYFINKPQVLEVQPEALANLGLSDTDFATLSAGLLDKLAIPKAQFTGVFRINNGPEVYMVQSGKRYHIDSPTALTQKGYSFAQVVSLDTATASLFPDSGKKILAQGQLFRLGTTDPIYLVNSPNTSLHIPSSQLIRAYGHSIEDVASYTVAQTVGYPNTGKLQYFAKDSTGNVWQIDNNGQKRSVLADISEASVYMINISNLPTLSDFILNRLSSLSPLTNLIRVAGQKQVYKIENGVKHWVTSRSVFDSLGLVSGDVRTVSSGFCENIPTGQAL